MENASLSTADLGRLTGATRKALRLYEQRGLITRPERSYSGWRQYQPKAVEEVRFILGSLAAGLHLADLKPALDAWRSGKSACPSIAQVLEQRIGEVQARLRLLSGQRERLKAIARERDCACPPTRSICPQLTEPRQSQCAPSDPTGK